MDRRSAVRRLLAASAGSIFSNLLGGTTAQDDQEKYTIRSEVRLVLLDVSVKDKQGRLVPGLIKDNFEVLEDGKPQRITVFDHNDLPVTVGIIVDESRSMTPKRSHVLTAAQTFIEESNRQDEIFVLNFNDTVMPGLPRDVLFSDSVQQLGSALYRGIPQGRTALYDAVVAGMDQLERGKRDKKALVVISDGGDNASTHRRGEVVDRVERSIATIYTIGLFEPDDPEINPGMLRQLAKISGGEAYFPASPAATIPVCRSIAKDIRTRYTLGYLPQPGKRSLRHIRVRASARGQGELTTHTRSSYRYEQTETQKK